MRGQTEGEKAPTCRARRVARDGRVALALTAGIGSAIVVITADRGGRRGPSPSNPQPTCRRRSCRTARSSPVDDTSAGCIDSVLHNINFARSLEGLGPMVLPSGYASDSVPMQQLIITDEERGDRGLPQFTGLDPSSTRPP